jgi:hypothetical protein
MSTLLLIPWIIFGFKNPHESFLGLRQTKKSLLFLLFVEIAYFTALFLLLDKSDPNVAGQGSFAWMYMFFYEKGIFPCFCIVEQINPLLGDEIDNNYQFMYLITALLIDYVLLKTISPKQMNKSNQ